MLIYNIGWGPWSSCAFFRKMVTSTTVHATALEADGPLCHMMWPRILLDRGHNHSTDDATVGLPARKAMLSKITTCPSDLLSGDKVSQKSFFSLNKTNRFWSSRYNELALSLVHMAMKEGWVLVCVCVCVNSNYL